jgi:hypothetical protein
VASLVKFLRQVEGKDAVEPGVQAGRAAQEIQRNERKRRLQLDEVNGRMEEDTDNLAQALTAFAGEESGEGSESEEEEEEAWSRSNEKYRRELKRGRLEAKRRSAWWTLNLAVVVADGLALKFAFLRKTIKKDNPETLEAAKVAAEKGVSFPSIRYFRRRR